MYVIEQPPSNHSHLEAMNENT